MCGRSILNLQLFVGLALALVLLGLTGCANPSYTRTASGASWSEAYVDHLIGPQDQARLVAPQNDCRLNTASTVASQQWALVHARRVPGQVYRVVPVTADQSVTEGQKVWIQGNQCQVRTTLAR